MPCTHRHRDALPRLLRGKIRLVRAGSFRFRHSSRHLGPHPVARTRQRQQLPDQRLYGTSAGRRPRYLGRSSRRASSPTRAPSSSPTASTSPARASRTRGRLTAAAAPGCSASSSGDRTRPSRSSSSGSTSPARPAPSPPVPRTTRPAGPTRRRTAPPAAPSPGALQGRLRHGRRRVRHEELRQVLEHRHGPAQEALHDRHHVHRLRVRTAAGSQLGGRGLDLSGGQPGRLSEPLV